MAFPASILGVMRAEVVTGLYHINYFRPSSFERERLKRLRLSKGYSATGVAVVPVAICGVLIELAILVLVNRGILRLSLGSTSFWTMALTVGSGLIGYFVALIYAQLLFAFNEDIRNEALQRKSEDTEMDHRVKMIGKVVRQLRETEPSVCRCGICGDVSTIWQKDGTARFIKDSSSLVLCSSCAYVQVRSIIACPSCGYRLAPGWNRAYYQEHRCASCGVAMDSEAEVIAQLYQSYLRKK